MAKQTPRRNPKRGKAAPITPERDRLNRLVCNIEDAEQALKRVQVLTASIGNLARELEGCEPDDATLLRAGIVGACTALMRVTQYVAPKLDGAKATALVVARGGIGTAAA